MNGVIELVRIGKRVKKIKIIMLQIYKQKFRHHSQNINEGVEKKYFSSLNY